MLVGAELMSDCDVSPLSQRVLCIYGANDLLDLVLRILCTFFFPSYFRRFKNCTL